MKETSMLFSSESEIGILSEIIMDGEKINEALRCGLQPIHFFSDYYRMIYEIMLDIKNKKIPIDIVSISSTERAENNHITPSALANITSTSYSFHSISYSCRLVKELHAKRNIEACLAQILESIKTSDIESIISELEDIKKYSQCKINLSDMLINPSCIKKSVNSLSVKTGFKEIDKRIGGLNGGTFTILSGDSGAGKSTLLNQILANMIYDGYKCVLYSGELTNDNVLAWLHRTIANESDLSIITDKNGIKRFEVNDNAKCNINKWLDNKLYLYGDQSSHEISTLLNVIENSNAIYGVQIFAIDNLMTITDKSKDLYDKQRHISKELKEIAKRLNVIIIMVAHNRKNKEGKFSMYDISGASEIVNLSDHIITIKRDDTEENNAFISITKNRTTGKMLKDFSITLDPKRKRFYEYFDNELKLDYRYIGIHQLKIKEAQ